MSEIRTSCPECGNDTFAVVYDTMAQGHHVECARCGNVMGAIR